MIFLLVILTSLSFTTAFPEQIPTYDSLSNEVKTHLNLVLSEKYSMLYRDMRQNCKSEYQPQAIIHLQIIEGRKNSTQNDMVIWEAKAAPCSLKLFSTSDEVLSKWCAKQPQAFVNFLYNHTGKALWNHDPNFLTVVQTSCHRFTSGDDFPRPRFYQPYDYKEEQIKLFLAFAMLMASVALVVSCVYCHRVPLRKHMTARWEKYWDVKEWHQLNAIVEYRERMYKEDLEQQMIAELKKMQEEDAKAAAGTGYENPMF
ncbi:Protein CBG27198 [Caenorhabditis briggsae]|uniref:Protein CBG27198 n=2 Tax=Caenorhabditis briggsae TaxID=6238 RepID=B6IL28_CAEBR|nr:Protein CBG27198 [Caenorhabditis briggsae]ULT90926.1 hypothetical protein L3Y34_008905 [Caenorhabditis briggsae]CAS00661.1 Protein CBG27198 [Caenorhabditis briggsae]